MMAEMRAVMYDEVCLIATIAFPILREFLRNGSQMDINRIQSLLNRSNESFADALKEMRADGNVAALARAVNVSKSAWYRWEGGETLPEHRDNIETIATALNLPLSDRMRLFRAYFRDLVRFALHKAGVSDEGESNE